MLKKIKGVLRMNETSLHANFLVKKLSILINEYLITS